MDLVHRIQPWLKTPRVYNIMDAISAFIAFGTAATICMTTHQMTFTEKAWYFFSLWLMIISALSLDKTL
jgi:hypothetical protein